MVLAYDFHIEASAFISIIWAYAKDAAHTIPLTHAIYAGTSTLLYPT